jgi:hypothetical protein
VGCVCRYPGGQLPNLRDFVHLAINRGLTTKRQCVRSKAQLPKAAGACRAKPGNVVTGVLSTTSVRRSGRFPS